MQILDHFPRKWPCFFRGEARRPDGAVSHASSVFIFQPHPGAEKNTRDVGRRAVHDFQGFEPLAQKAYAPVYLAQLFLAVNVFSVLRAVALGRGLRYRLRHPRPLHAPQMLQLLAQTLRTLRRDVGRAFGGWERVSAHGAGLYPALTTGPLIKWNGQD